jgi:hypothetical protein
VALAAPDGRVLASRTLQPTSPAGPGRFEAVFPAAARPGAQVMARLSAADGAARRGPWGASAPITLPPLGPGPVPPKGDSAAAPAAWASGPYHEVVAYDAAWEEAAGGSGGPPLPGAWPGTLRPAQAGGGGGSSSGGSPGCPMC